MSKLYVIFSMCFLKKKRERETYLLLLVIFLWKTNRNMALYQRISSAFYFEFCNSVNHLEAKTAIDRQMLILESAIQVKLPKIYT